VNSRFIKKYPKFKDWLLFCSSIVFYELGRIENLNGLIRQYISKGNNFDDIDALFIKQVEEKLNIRPRKILNFLTLLEFCETMKNILN
jgi:IS30 family transposase